MKYTKIEYQKTKYINLPKEIKNLFDKQDYRSSFITHLSHHKTTHKTTRKPLTKP